MTETGYPKAIGFKCHNPEGLTADAQEWLRRLRNEVTITMLAENIIQIKYPADIVELIKTVNVDDTIYRLDFIAPDDRFWMCNCVFLMCRGTITTSCRTGGARGFVWNQKEFCLSNTQRTGY